MANQLMWCQQDGTVAINAAPVDCWVCDSPMMNMGWIEDGGSEGDAEEQETSQS